MTQVCNASDKALMMLMVLPAAEIWTTAIATLCQVRLEGLEVLMGAGCAKSACSTEEAGTSACYVNPCSTCSLGQGNISGSIYFNRPNDTSISHKRNVKVK